MAAPPPLRLQQQQVSNGTKETRRDGRPLCTHGAVAEQCPLCAADAKHATKTASDAGSAALAGVAVAMAALAAIPQSPRRMSLGPQPYVYSPPPPSLENPQQQQQPKKRPASVGPLPFAFVVGQPPLLPLRQYEERQAASLSCDECCAAEPATNAPPITPQQPAPKQQQQQKAAASLTPKEKKKAELEQLKEEKRRKREEKEAKKRAEKEAKEAKKREEKEAKKRAHEEKKRRGSGGSKTAKKPEKQQQQQQQRIHLAAGGGDPTAQQQHTSQQEQTATAVQTLVAMGFTENQVHRARLALERAKKRVTVDLLLDMLVADASMPQQHTAPEVSHSVDTPSSPLSAEEHRPDASKSEPPPEPEPEAADSSALLPSAPPASKEACIVCFEHDVNAVLIPCGHLGLCMRCAEQIVAASGVCPVCRAPVASVVQVFRTAAC